MSEVTLLLNAMGQGDPQAAEKLLPLVYQELRSLARGRMGKERTEHTLQATALVHEAYLRLVGQEADQRWDGRGHFFAAAAEAMRRILIEHARRKHALKYGGGHEHVPFDADLPAIVSPCHDLDDLLALNDALDKLTREDPGKADVVKLLYFVGFNLEETASALGFQEPRPIAIAISARARLLDAMLKSTTEAHVTRRRPKRSSS